MDELQLMIEHLDPDGNCFFNAVALYLGIDQADLRNKVAEELVKDPDSYINFLENRTGNDDEDMKNYIEGIQTNIWGGHIEIVILSRVYNRPIIIIRPGGTPQDFSQRRGEPIYVYYNGANHYDGLVSKVNKNISSS